MDNFIYLIKSSTGMPAQQTNYIYEEIKQSKRV